MKLLFDQNLSPQLVRLLAAEFPESTHVRMIGLREAEDVDIWGYAQSAGCTIVSKDKDFYDRAIIHGPPPKVILLRIGNGPTRIAANLILANCSDIIEFIQAEKTSILILS